MLWAIPNFTTPCCTRRKSMPQSCGLKGSWILRSKTSARDPPKRSSSSLSSKPKNIDNSRRVKKATSLNHIYFSPANIEEHQELTSLARLSQLEGVGDRKLLQIKATRSEERRVGKERRS